LIAAMAALLHFASKFAFQLGHINSFQATYPQNHLMVP